MKLSITAIKQLSKIKNSVYDAIKIEYLYHSNKLEGSTFSKENLIDLLQQRQVNGEHYLDDVIETNNSLELFDTVVNSLEEPFDKYLLWNWHRILKKGSIDEEIDNNIDLIAIDDEYNTEYKTALFEAQSTQKIDNLIKVFEKCQSRLDEKLKDYEDVLNQFN